MVLMNIIVSEEINIKNKITRETMKRKYCTAKEMQIIDKKAQEVYGIPSIVLMENAGISSAEVALKMLGRGRKALCICGKGNNAGDGFVCARHLINKGVNVAIFLLASPKHLKFDARINFNILKKLTKNIYFINKSSKLLKSKLKTASLIIDAIFGIGLTGQIKKPYASIINLINSYNKKILALDVPSGLNATRGEILGTCIKATETITFALAKSGMIKNNGPSYCGKVHVADISIPKALLK